MKKLLFLLALWLLPQYGYTQNVLTPETLWKLNRVSEPTVSPDGKTIVYGITTYDLQENRGNGDLYVLPVVGGAPKRLTDFPGTESGPMWRPDGQWIGFLSAREDGMQLWEIRPDGTGLRRVSSIPDGITGFKYAPDGRHVLYTKDVKLDQNVTEIYPDLPKAEARIIDALMYRHWNEWHDYSYSHVFVADYGDGTLSNPVDILEGERFDAPLTPFGGVEQISWSKDGRRVVYTSKKLTGKEAAVSTNSDLYEYDLEKRTTKNLTDGMMGYDIEPVYSPDGKSLAWLSMETDGYEADRNRLFVLDLSTGEKKELSAAYDNNIHGLRWAKDNRTIYFYSETDGTTQLFSIDRNSGSVRQLTEGEYDYEAFDVAEAGNQSFLVVNRQSISSPSELYRVNQANGEVVSLTKTNEAILSTLQFGRVDKRMVKATDGKDILTWVIYPPGFDPARKYPVLLYCQGGPQSTVSQFFSYRWNFQLMAANGYIVVAPNRRGLPGFGQDWNLQISGDWGGQAMNDLLSAIDDVSREPYVDRNRMGAVGASFGGFSVYWLAGHHEKRFKTFIAHAGVFNLESMYGTTEELFFVNCDLKGPYWSASIPSSFEAFSPHRFVRSWDTPMLVVHGEKDFRVPVTEGMQAFTALQVKGIPSRFLYFPEEGHWINKPQNSVLWQRVFFEWLGRFLKTES